MTGQEAFKDVLYILSAVSNYEIDTNCETIKTIEKELKAFEIIKEKRIDIESFYITFIEDNFDYNHYEKFCGTYGLECLTEEEFDLLIEVLK